MKIGDQIFSVPVMMAPMAGVTNPEFRWLVASYGASIVVSEMISVEGLVRKDRRTWHYLRSFRKVEGVSLKNISAVEFFQLFGSRPDSFAEAAKILQGEGINHIDINAGCPVPKVVRQGAGSALLKNPDRLVRIVDTVRNSAPDAVVTVKLRLGWDNASINILKVASDLAELDIAAIIVHARTAKQMYSGKACWEWVKKLKALVKIPIIGNGDIFSPNDVVARMKETGCDGVMIGRGALGNPWFFQVLAAYFDPASWKMPEDNWEDLVSVVEAFTRLLERAGYNIGFIRKNMMWFSRGCPRSALFRGEIIKRNTVDDMLRCFQRWIELTVLQSGVSFLDAKGLRGVRNGGQGCQNGGFL